MKVRRAKREEIDVISSLMCRNFLEVNIRDYPRQVMEELAENHVPERVLKIAENGHMYVAQDGGGRIIGTGTICRMDGSAADSYIMSVSVLPECHGKGIGRRIMEALEADKLFAATERTELHASITAHRFYGKLGYRYMTDRKQPDELGLYHMEKWHEQQNGEAKRTEELEL